METLERILTGMPWFAWIAIVGILSACVKSIVSMTHEHEEQMERIRADE
jgi:predicted outer membrane lipoprotein